MGQLILNDEFELQDNLDYKVEKAINRLKTFEPKEGYYLAFSGGKDSIVIKRLAEIAKVKFDAHYNRTSVDPPELIRYIKKYHPDVEFSSTTTMWKLIPRKLMPPTRLVRYCCEVLKEHGGEGRFVITGVRWAESTRRKNNRSMVETNFGSKSKKDNIVIHLNNDNDAARRMVEQCTLKSKHVLNPIIDWSDSEVWEFIRRYNLPYCELYDQGFDRLGCIGCPMQGTKGMERDFERYPKFKKAYLRAFDRMLQVRKEKGLETDWKTAEEVMNWWLYNQ